MNNLLLFLLLVGLIAVNIQLRKLTMNQQELAQELSNLTAQLLKALNEIIAALQAGQEVTPEVIEKLEAAKALAQQLDDLNPDQP